MLTGGRGDNASHKTGEQCQKKKKKNNRIPKVFECTTEDEKIWGHKKTWPESGTHRGFERVRALGQGGGHCPARLRSSLNSEGGGAKKDRRKGWSKKENIGLLVKGSLPGQGHFRKGNVGQSGGGGKPGGGGGKKWEIVEEAGIQDIAPILFTTKTTPTKKNPKKRVH